MKKILFLFLAIILSGCCTTKYIEVPVPIKVELDENQLPLREELLPKDPEDTLEQHLLKRVSYYSSLVKEWESWGIYVYETLDIPLPDSLQSVKISEEKIE